MQSISSPRLARVTLAAASLLLLAGGCASDRNSAIPAAAVIRAEGNGDTVSAMAEQRGTVYVYDSTDRKVVWSGDVRMGQSVMVSAKDDNVTLDGRPVHQKGIHAGHTYRIFFNSAGFY